MTSHPHHHQDETMRPGTDVEALSAVVNRDIEGVKSSISQPPFTSNFALFQGTKYTPSQLFQQWKSSKLKEEAKGQHLVNDTSRDISQAINTEQSANETNLIYKKQMPIVQVLPIIKTHVDKDRATQLQGLHDRLTANRINKSEFLRQMGKLVGPHIVKMSVYKAQQQQMIENASNHMSTSEDDSFEMMDSLPGFSMPMNKPEPKFITAQLECQNMAVENFSLTSESNERAHPRKPSVGPKKPSKEHISSKSKKQKVCGSFSDQSIQQLNDVTAVSGVNLREEEEQLFSKLKEDTRVSEASRKIVQEEEDKLFLQKIPLQKKLAEIMAKYGVKHISNDLERCLSLCVEERLRGFISNLVKHSKQRVDFEKCIHQTVVTSDIRQQIMLMNQKAQEELEKKQAAAEQLQRTDEVMKEGGDKIRTCAANVAARAAIGGDDVLLKWQLMARQKCDAAGADSASTSLPSNIDVAPNAMSASEQKPKDNPDTERNFGVIHGPMKCSSKNQDLGQSGHLMHSISVKDVLSVLMRENHLSRSTLTYRLHEKLHSNF